MPYLESHKLRLNRATMHLNELMEQAQFFLASEPFGYEIEYYQDSGKSCLRFVYKVYREPPRNLGIIAGDCIHNLRASLDNIVWSLGQVYSSSDPKARNDRLAFPVYDNKQEYIKALNRPELKGILDFPEEAQRLIESLQPYNNTNPESHRLSILHKLWNADKHRSPEIMGGAPRGVSVVGYNLSDGGLSAGLYIKNGRSFGFGTIPKQGIAPDAKVTLLHTEICFHEDGPASGYTVIGFLYELLQFVNLMINKFELTFPRCSSNT